MELAPRYCRSCGSRILVKNVCHNCNNDPLKGDNYCYDCGALTPNAESCLKCGARYKRSSPIKTLLVAGSLLIIAIAVAGYFISQPGKPSSESAEKTIADTSATSQNIQQELPRATDTIINNPVDTSALKNTKVADNSQTKTAVNNIPVVTPPITDSVKKTDVGAFTLEERKLYNIKCSYFTKNQKGNVLFFIASGSGYIKMNDKIYELKRKRKGVDIAVFGNNEYEATVTIDGLSGSAKEWVASCTLIIKDIVQNITARHKVYSSCIEL